MLVKDIISTDFLNYKKPSMYIAFPYCTFKCEKDCGIKCCQNSALAQQKNIDISIDRIVEIYKQNSAITKAVVCCGMEPFDSWNDLLELVLAFREFTDDDFVIYTGYKEDEIPEYIRILKNYNNIIIKFGRFVPDKESHLDPVIGVKLMNPEQYAKKIS